MDQSGAPPAELPDLTLATMASKDIFRDALLAEQGWEFVSEGKRREDLIRHGKSMAIYLY